MKSANENTINITNATVPFTKGISDGKTTYKFSTVDGGHPMVNAMAGLAILKENEQLIMLNHCSPEGLYPKIMQEFDYVISTLSNGNTQIVFTKKEESKASTDFSSTSCSGGCS